MAAIPRKTQQVFAGALTAPGNIAKYGSLAASAPAYSSDLAQIQTAAWLQGLLAALINAPGGLASPALEDFNGIFYVITTQLAYILQTGIGEWDAGTDYQTNSFCKVGSVVYVSKVDNNSNNLVTDTNFWKTYASTLNNARGIAKAWVTFDGRTGAILDSFNVASVNRTAVGCYQVNFIENMANAFYSFAGSCGPQGGTGFTGADDNYITGGAPGKVSNKGISGFSVFCYDRVDTATQDSSSISIIVFGA